ncbi:MAG: type IX secretion system membrane protein PorP/SprF [Flavobacteriales bacterium]|nr:type IX secretion system membrane protein PorP/SprF [Flavobacteriales bacterium]
MRYAVHITTAMTALGALCSHAQHSPLTSQYLFNGLLINPAYAGSRDALAANLTYRHQWAGFDGAPVTQVLSVHAPLKGRKVGLGAMVFNDRIGVTNETGFFTNYAYRMRLGKGKLALGLGAGVNMLQANWSQVQVQDESDVNFSSNTRSVVRPNFSGGVFYYQKRYFLGLSLPFFLSRQYDPERETFLVTNDVRKYQPMLTGGYLWSLGRNLKLKPSAMIRYQVSAWPQADLNTNLIIKDMFWVGVSYRTEDAVVGMFEVLPTPQWRLGYSYDLGLSRIAPHHAGTHELMIQYEFGYRIRVRDPRYF